MPIDVAGGVLLARIGRQLRAVMEEGAQTRDSDSDAGMQLPRAAIQHAERFQDLVDGHRRLEPFGSPDRRARRDRGRIRCFIRQDGALLGKAEAWA